MPYVPTKYVALGFAVVFIAIIGNGLHVEIRPEGWLVEYKGGNVGGVIAAVGALISGVIATGSHHDQS